MNKKEYQKEYFKYMYVNYPTLTYNDIILLITEGYKPKQYYYTLKTFNHFELL